MRSACFPRSYNLYVAFYFSRAGISSRGIEYLGFHFLQHAKNRFQQVLKTRSSWNSFCSSCPDCFTHNFAHLFYFALNPNLGIYHLLCYTNVIYWMYQCIYIWRNEWIVLSIYGKYSFRVRYKRTFN